jgi:hypothetical protein
MLDSIRPIDAVNCILTTIQKCLCWHFLQGMSQGKRHALAFQLVIESFMGRAQVLLVKTVHHMLPASQC